MNKKFLIILIAALILVLVGIGVIFYFQSFKNVHFNFKTSDELFITVYRQEGDDERSSIATIDTTGDFRLQEGTYVYVPDGAIYSPAPVEFEVKDKDITLDVNPDFSSTYRRSLLTAELPMVQAAIKTAYPEIISNFTISDGEIYERGQWYATTLVQKVQGNEEGDIYRTVLKKEDGKWVIKATPALILSSKDYPDIPKAILSSVNVR